MNWMMYHIFMKLCYQMDHSYDQKGDRIPGFQVSNDAQRSAPDHSYVKEPPKTPKTLEQFLLLSLFSQIAVCCRGLRKRIYEEKRNVSICETTTTTTGFWVHQLTF